tara:strand:- start:4963 stop:5202 length:240 start_codon:yes stop_codon:yes gene_type:complete
MSDSNYTKIYTGSFIIVTHIVDVLKQANINAVVKDDTESARLAGFGGGIVPGFQELFVNNDELDKAIPILENILSEIKE